MSEEIKSLYGEESTLGILLRTDSAKLGLTVKAASSGWASDTSLSSVIVSVFVPFLRTVCALANRRDKLGKRGNVLCSPSLSVAVRPTAVI